MFFIKPVILAALSLALIPIILHLFAKAKMKNVYFPALLFLTGSKKSSLRKITLRQLIVLLLRTAIIIALVTACAQPFIKRSIMPFLINDSGKAIHIVIDNSSSMSFAFSGRQSIKSGINAAYNIIDNSGKNDVIVVETLCGDTFLSNLELDKPTLKHRLNSIHPLRCHPGFGTIINRSIYSLLDTALPDRNLVFISDFQKNQFDNAAIHRAEKPISMYLLSTTPRRKPSNYFIYDVTPPLFPLSGEENSFCFSIHTNGVFTDDIVAAIYIDGAKRGEKSVSGLSKNEKTCFPITLGASGRHYGWISIAGDQYTGDNVFYFLFDVKSEINAGIISDPSNKTDFNKNDYYIIKAVKSFSRESDSSGPVRINFLSKPSHISENISKYNVIIIPDRKYLDRASILKLVNYVKNGGGLFIVGGDSPKWNDDFFIDAFFNGEIKKILFPNNNQTGIMIQTPAHIDTLHPLFGFLPDDAVKSFMNTRFSNFTNYKIVSPNISAPALLGDDIPLIMQKYIGAGNMVFLNTDLSPDKSNFPLKPCFVPFVFNSIRYISNSNSMKNNENTLVNDENKIVRVRNIIDGVTYKVKNTNINQHFAPELNSGVYKKGEDFYFTLNEDVRESELSYATEKFVMNYFKEFSPEYFKVGYTTHMNYLKNIQSRKTTILWMIFIFAGFILLLIETLFSNSK